MSGYLVKLDTDTLAPVSISIRRVPLRKPQRVVWQAGKPAPEHLALNMDDLLALIATAMARLRSL